MQQGYQYIGIDISEGMIAEAIRRHPKAIFLQQSLYALDFPKNSFDGFWSACSLLHIPKDRIDAVLSSIKQILKPGAIGFISIKQGTKFLKKDWHKTGNERFFTYYEKDEFIKILSRSGFEILETAIRPPANADQDGTYLIFYTKLSK